MRIERLQILIGLLFLLLAGGLFSLQVVKGRTYRDLADRNRIRLVRIEAERGRIFDRTGACLVGSRFSFTISIIPQELTNKEKAFVWIGKLLGASPREIERIYKKNYLVPFAPVPIREDVDQAVAFRVEENRWNVPGVIIEVTPVRSYYVPEACAHLSGYISLMNRDEIELLKEYGYRPRDLIGKNGLEKYYDFYLKGRDGGEQIEVNSSGKKMRMLGIKEPVAGKDLYTTIDGTLQRFIYGLIRELHAAVVVMDPVTGEVLALVNAPSYDPNVFVSATGGDERRQILQDPDSPLLNRTMHSLYPPGSTFKPIVAAAAFDRGVIDRNTSFFCDGKVNKGGWEFKCWKASGHGDQAVVQALTHSCNVFFFETGLLLGIDQLARYAAMFGFGRPTGIDLPYEREGVVPNPLWKWVHCRREAWFGGDTMNTAIGQGYLLATPLQVATAISAMGNGGSFIRPFIVKRIGETLQPLPRPRKLAVSPAALGIVKEGMVGVVNAPDGTGMKAFVEGVSIAGKTGTAQAGEKRSHAWFAGYAPSAAPRYTVVVLVEQGTSGGYVAAPIAQKIFAHLKERGLL